jgi:hypothetical protein
MIMEIHAQEKTDSNQHKGEALECNRNFYQRAKELGIDPTFVHTDKDWSEISAVRLLWEEGKSLSEQFERGIFLAAILQ